MMSLDDAGYRFLEDVALADVAFNAWGGSLDAMFRSAGHAVMATMMEEPETLAAVAIRTVALESETIDLLLFDFLQEFIYFKDAERLLLRPDALAVSVGASCSRLEGSLVGEPIDTARHHLIVDVKAVTLHEFRVEQTVRGWETFVILDV